MMLKHNVQKIGQPWTDETGISIPFNRINPSEKLKEKLSGELIKSALKINNGLIQFKAQVVKAVDDVRKAMIDDKTLPKESKGNLTIYNFDRSIKVEVSINEMIQFDESMIASAREQLDKFIAENVQGTDEVVRTLINTAFHNTKGGLDTKRVLSLLKYRSKIKDRKFQRALDLIEQSISRPSSKKYFRIWAKNEDGAYENVDLNFSSI